MIKAYWHLSKNFGDTLTPIIVKYFTGQDVQFAERKVRGKLIAVGSVIVALRANDIVWGTGSIRAGGKGCIKQPPGAKFLALRGPLTWNLIQGADQNIPQVFGDPAILLPLIYNPKIEKIHKVGVIPHRVEKAEMIEKIKTWGHYFIDIDLPWQEFIREVLSCEEIISSSLHGIVTAEAYGIPAKWAVFSDKIIGGKFKYNDYFLGTGRQEQEPFKEIPPIENLDERQKKLIEALQKYYGGKN